MRPHDHSSPALYVGTSSLRRTQLSPLIPHKEHSHILENHWHLRPCFRLLNSHILSPGSFSWEGTVSRKQISPRLLRFHSLLPAELLLLDCCPRGRDSSQGDAWIDLRPGSCSLQRQKLGAPFLTFKKWIVCLLKKLSVFYVLCVRNFCQIDAQKLYSPFCDLSFHYFNTTFYFKFKKIYIFIYFL